MSKTGKDLLWSLVAALLFILVKGYWFNNSDQEEHLPQVYKLFNPQLYKGDYFVEPATSVFTIRWFYVYTVYIFSVVMTVPVAVFFLHVVMITLTAFSIKKIAEHFSSSATAHLLAPFFVLLVFNECTVGGNNFEDIQLTCTVFANAGCMAAIYFFLKQKYSLAGLACGLAALYQVLMGLHVVVILLACLLFLKQEKKLKTMSLMFFVFLLASSPMLINILLRQSAAGSDADNGLFYYALYVFRNSNHYIPSFFPLSNYIKSAALVICAMAAVFIFNHPSKKFFLIFCFTIITGMFVFYFMFEQMHIMQTGKLQWFKTSTWLSAMCAIVLAGYAGQWIEKILKINFYSRALTFATVIATLLLFLFITNSAMLPGKLNSRYMIGNYQKSDLTLMHEWIKSNTPIDTKILSFPSDDSFLCEAQRPMPVAFKAIIHEPWFLNAWYINFKKFYSVEDNIIFIPKNAITLGEKYFYSNDNAPLLKQNGIRMRLLQSSKCSFPIDAATIIHRQGDYILTSL